MGSAFSLFFSKERLSELLTDLRDCKSASSQPLSEIGKQRQF
jgi:hypothetical protein